MGNKSTSRELKKKYIYLEISLHENWKKYIITFKKDEQFACLQDKD